MISYGSFPLYGFWYSGIFHNENMLVRDWCYRSFITSNSELNFALMPVYLCHDEDPYIIWRTNLCRNQYCGMNDKTNQFPFYFLFGAKREKFIYSLSCRAILHQQLKHAFHVVHLRCIPSLSLSLYLSIYLSVVNTFFTFQITILINSTDNDAMTMAPF